eukprot:COSAG06_NODE_55724_length_288_cov_0.820106_1_plen_27_part_10
MHDEQWQFQYAGQCARSIRGRAAVSAR